MHAFCDHSSVLHAYLPAPMHIICYRGMYPSRVRSSCALWHLAAVPAGSSVTGGFRSPLNLVPHSAHALSSIRAPASTSNKQCPATHEHLTACQISRASRIPFPQDQARLVPLIAMRTLYGNPCVRSACCYGFAMYRSVSLNCPTTST